MPRRCDRLLHPGEDFVLGAHAVDRLQDALAAGSSRAAGRSDRCIAAAARESFPACRRPGRGPPAARRPTSSGTCSASTRSSGIRRSASMRVERLGLRERSRKAIEQAAAGSSRLAPSRSTTMPTTISSGTSLPASENSAASDAERRAAPAGLAQHVAGREMGDAELAPSAAGLASLFQRPAVPRRRFAW